MDFYREVILDHYRQPRHAGHLASPTVTEQGVNPLCGDEIMLDVAIKNGKVLDAAFVGQGCAISQAAASLLLDEVIGQSVSAVKAWTNKQHLALLSIDLTPTRMKCALLSLKTLQLALSQLPS